MYEWVKGSVYNMVTTLYPTNITLNSSATSHFKDIRWVMLGLDRENYKLAIRPVTKREIDLRLVPMDQLHKISIGKGYGRISHKNIMLEIQSLLGKSVDGLKLATEFDEEQNLLVIDLKGEI
ncbi:MAG: hypothetical protein PUF50_00895 [Erysipelotrichaceae bacterium]|nr:hypothetical protein [Erysipelotrichaceae bacterium]